MFIAGTTLRRRESQGKGLQTRFLFPGVFAWLVEVVAVTHARGGLTISGQAEYKAGGNLSIVLKSRGAGSVTPSL
jgi:hypothetical protein